MRLYYFPTPNPRKPCAVAKYLKSPVDFVHVDLRKGEQKAPEFLAVNPNGKVPALADGDVNLWEAHAIMAYLALKAESDLWPSDPRAQIEVVKWLNWETAHFSRHAGRLLFNNYIKPTFGIGEPDPAEITEATEFFEQFAGVLDSHLQGRDFILGDHLTIADFAVGSFLPTAEEAKLPLTGRDQIRRWHDSLMAIEAWENPWP